MTVSFRTISIFFLLAFLSSNSHAQSVKKKIRVHNGWAKIDSTSISPYEFTVIYKNDTLSPNAYQLNTEKALVKLKDLSIKQIDVSYYKFPSLLSKTAQWIDPSKILPSGWYNQPLLSQTSNLKKNKNRQPFYGLESQGSINRGLSFGNNQSAVVNSSLDLQISGKLSEKVTLQASISDTNLPLQENGYSQNIEEFDRIYMRMFSKNWEIQGGDLMLENNSLNFLKFQKKATGLLVGIHQDIEDPNFKSLVSGAIVRGKFSRNNIQAIDNNQGPYKLNGANGEPFIIILSGSETVYVNGKALQRGEQADYTIDYNTSELTFNTNFPIKGSQRIIVEFQYSDRSYNRFVTYNNAEIKSGKLQFGAYVYSESDAKNQPLQTNLNEEQIEILTQAGNDKSLMVAPSAIAVEYNDNEILYQKTSINNKDIFIYSQDANSTLYRVSFKLMGAGKGAYELSQQTAIGNIYTYVGEQLGAYDPVVDLTAPNKQQIAAATLVYEASNSNKLSAELAVSNNDANLFSDIDNNENKGWAAQFNWNQKWKNKNKTFYSNSNYDRIDQNFKSIQPLYNVEFNRDWAVINPIGTLQKVKQLIGFKNKNKNLSYQFEHLSIGNHYIGNKHELEGKIKTKRNHFQTKISLMNNDQTENQSKFLRGFIQWERSRNKGWHGAEIDLESVEIVNKADKSWDLNSQKYEEAHLYWGWGNKKDLFTVIGSKLRVNDSVALGKLQKVNLAKQFYLESNLIDNKETKLNIYADYRALDNTFMENTQRLQTRVKFRKNFWENQIISNTLYENNQGLIPMQNFQYVETDPGQGYYTWIDYNNNNIKEFDEFEVAQFNDQARYLRIGLPAINYIPANKSKFYQSLSVNLTHWNKKTGFKKWLSNWMNQSFMNIQSQQKNSGVLISNPFKTNGSDILGLLFSIQNNLYYKRGKQDNSLTFSYAKTNQKQLFGLGFQNLETQSLLWEWQNLFHNYWLVSFTNSYNKSEQAIENFNQRNHNLKGLSLNPKITYQVNRNHFLELSYLYQENKNSDPIASLYQNEGKLTYQNNTSKKNQFKATYSFISNQFQGPTNHPLSFTMLEGLQAGNNSVWEVQFQRNINAYINLNLIYNGRKSDLANSIHIGSVQLKAVF